MVRLKARRKARQTLLPYVRARIEWIWPKADGSNQTILSQSFSFDRREYTWMDVTEAFLHSMGETDVPNELRQKFVEAQERIKREHLATWEQLVLAFPKQMEG